MRHNLILSHNFLQVCNFINMVKMHAPFLILAVGENNCVAAIGDAFFVRSFGCALLFFAIFTNPFMHTIFLMEDNMDNNTNAEKSIVIKKEHLIFAGIIAVLIAALVLVIVFSSGSSSNKGPQKELITQSTLQEIVTSSKLSTFEATYNGIAKKPNEKNPEECDYYVSYEATVKVGIDFDKIGIEVNKDEKTVTVTIPQVQIQKITVDMTSLDFIFIEDSANVATVTEEAYKLCINDVETETKSQNAIFALAEENATNIVTALIKPFVKQVDPEYKITIK